MVIVNFSQGARAFRSKVISVHGCRITTALLERKHTLKQPQTSMKHAPCSCIVLPSVHKSQE